MFSKKYISNPQTIRKIIISIIALFVLSVVGYNILGYLGLVYIKYDEAKVVYDFMEDMDGDGKKENIKLVNHYNSYYQRNTCDAEYTSNHLKIYLNDKEIYNNEFITLGPLLNPQMVDLVEKNTIKKQIFLHARGGGPAIPMDYFFKIVDNNVVVSIIEPQ